MVETILTLTPQSSSTPGIILVIQGKNFCSNKECGKVEISSSLDLNIPFETFASDYTAQVLSYTHTEIAVAYTSYTGRIRIGVKGKGTEINYSNDNKIFAYRSPEIDETTITMLDMRRGETNGFNTIGTEELTITGRLRSDSIKLKAREVETNRSIVRTRPSLRSSPRASGRPRPTRRQELQRRAQL